jgi:hypothetical protein
MVPARRHAPRTGKARRGRWNAGLTLVEVLVGALVIAISVASLLGVFIWQGVLNEHARNLVWTMNDASRVMEELRHLNTTSAPGGCTTPTAGPPLTGNLPSPAFASWQAWLADTGAFGGGGLTLVYPGANETVQHLSAGGPDPLQVTIAVCWTHRGRVIGDCNTAGGISSPAMLTTFVTCR